MALRYSGDLQISVVYTDRDDYRTSVSKGERVLWRGRVRPAPAGFGAGVAYDSPKAYDKIAESPLAFADHDKEGLGDAAEHDESGYKIRRVKGYWQKWPGGQHKPKVLRDRRSRRRGRRDPTHRGNADLIRWFLREAHEAERRLYGFGSRVSPERIRSARAVTARNVRKLRTASRAQALGFVRKLGYKG